MKLHLLDMSYFRTCIKRT